LKYKNSNKQRERILFTEEQKFKISQENEENFKTSESADNKISDITIRKHDGITEMM